MRRGAARPVENAAGRLLEGAGDCTPREMTVRATFVVRQDPAYRPTAYGMMRQMMQKTILQPMRQRHEWSSRRTDHRRASGHCTTFALCALLVAACTPAHPSTAPAPASPSAGASLPGSTAGLAAAAPTGPLPPPPRYVTGHLVYDITSVGTVVTTGDTSAHPDTITTNTTLTYDARWSGSDLRLTGNVAAQVTAASPGLQAASQSSAPTATFSATIDSATGVVLFAKGVDSSRAAGASCAPGGPTVDQAREVATERPRSLDPGATWQDTLVDKSCLADIPLVTRATRVYTVSPEPVNDPISGASSVLVSHTSQATMIGGGPHLGRQITLNGQGGGTTEQYYDRVTGVMLSAHTVAALQLDVGQGGHVQRLVQHADWHAKLTSYAALRP